MASDQEQLFPKGSPDYVRYKWHVGYAETLGVVVTVKGRQLKVAVRDEGELCLDNLDQLHGFLVGYDRRCRHQEATRDQNEWLYDLGIGHYECDPRTGSVTFVRTDK